MKFLDYLAEEYYGLVGMGGATMVFKNPSSSDYADIRKEIAKDYSRKEYPIPIRFIIHNSELYVWDAWEANHDDVTKKFSLPKYPDVWGMGVLVGDKIDIDDSEHPDMGIVVSQTVTEEDLRPFQKYFTNDLKLDNEIWRF